MTDTIETLSGSVVQHGNHNDRVYVMKLNLQDVPGTLATVEDLAILKGYGKIFARIPRSAWPDFEKSGYRTEAIIPGLFRGRMDGLFVSRYFSIEREKAPINPSNLLSRTVNDRHAKMTPGTPHPALRQVAACRFDEAPAISAIYRQVFESYPFPIQDSGYLKKVMNENVRYYCVRAGDGIAALAAAEIDRENESVEMTDFATLPQWRRTGMADLLLRHMENETRQRGLQTAYTIARAASVGINQLFHSNSYSYAGQLVNNSQIAGSIQSMNVWYKKL